MTKLTAVKRPRTLRSIVDVLRAELPRLRERYGVKSLGIFGSYLRGRQRRGSDLDILVEFAEERPGRRLLDVQEDLERLLRLRVDLGERGHLKPYIGQRIVQEVLDVSDEAAACLVLARIEGGETLAEPQREIRDYLNDILSHISHIEQFLHGIEYEQLLENEEKAFAVLHAFQLIGESARSIPAEVRQRRPEIPWRSIIGLRNIIAHRYWELIMPDLWTIAHRDLVPLRTAVEAVLAELRNTNGQY